MLQKSFVEVNEEGTEAVAAVFAGYMLCGCSRDSPLLLLPSYNLLLTTILSCSLSKKNFLGLSFSLELFLIPSLAHSCQV